MLRALGRDAYVATDIDNGGGEGELRIALKVLLVLAMVFILARTIGYEMPYPDIVAPTFRMWAGAHEDAVLIEQLTEFVAIAAVVVFGGDWLLRRRRGSNWDDAT